jgi:hypothetical protein
LFIDINEDDAGIGGSGTPSGETEIHGHVFEGVEKTECGQPEDHRGDGDNPHPVGRGTFYGRFLDRFGAGTASAAV